MFHRFIIMLVVSVLAMGCGNEKERNRYRDLDRPQVGESEKSEKADKAKK